MLHLYCILQSQRYKRRSSKTTITPNKLYMSSCLLTKNKENCVKTKNK